MSSSRRRSRKREQDTSSCCTLPRIILLTVTLIVAAFLIWWFEPWKDFIGTASNGDQNQGGLRPATLTPQWIPTESPTPAPKFQFNKCDPQSGVGNCCNGLEGLCDLRADQIMYGTLHNAMSTVDDGFFIGANHVGTLEEALEAGYRALNLDICKCGGVHVFCHGKSCHARWMSWRFME